MAHNPTNIYDANNRLSFKNLSDNTYSSDIAYDYDLRGLTRSACFSSNAADIDCDTAPDGEGETKAFDGFGNLTARISSYDGYVRGLTYQYDLEGNRTRITHPDGVYFSYNRDGLNRTCTLGENAAAPACNTTDTNAYLVMHYSNEGRRAGITRAGGAVTSYATDNALRLESFSQDFAFSANDLTNGFGYNPASQIRSLTQSNAQYNYTEAQNRTGSYGVNGLNQYTQIDGATVSYDTKGNLTADGTGYVYTYDMENRLVATGGTKAATLAYDPMGRLSRYVVDGTTRHFHYDGDALVGMYSNGVLDHRYVHGDQVDEPLVQYAGGSVGSGNRRYVYADHQGSVIALGDSAGSVTQVNSYDAYGVPKSTNNGWFGYTGQVWLAQIDLNYYKARIYAPKVGRFLQSDPVFYADDFNLYAYVSNDPVNRIDPSGRQGQPLDKENGKATLGEHGLDNHGEYTLDKIDEMNDAAENVNNATTPEAKDKAEPKLEKATLRYLAALGQAPKEVSNQPMSNEVAPVAEAELEVDVYDAEGNLLDPGSEPMDGDTVVPRGAPRPPPPELPTRENK